jgi:hypothetical protein
MKTALTIDSSRPARGHQMDSQHRDDDLEQVVVESAQELRPEKGLESPALESVAIAVSRHVRSRSTAGLGRQNTTIEPWVGNCPERVVRNAEER